MRIHFLLKSDVLTFVAVVVPWTWGIWRVAGKKYFRSPYQTLPYSLLKVPIVSFRGREYEPGNVTREIWARKIYITFCGYCYQLLFCSALPYYNQSRHQLFRQWFITRGYVIYSPKKNKGNRAKWKINDFNEFELFRSMDGFALHPGSFSNDHGDGNDNGKNAMG